jgi:MFS family permease
MLGVGGLVAVPFTQRFGRIPVLWWAMFMSLWMTLFAVLAPNWIAFIAARCLQGFFTTAPQAIGLSFIHDMFFFHEHARKIGIWAWAFVISPYLGPFLSAIIANFQPWQTSFWIDFMIIGMALCFVTFLGDETLCDRDNVDKQPAKPTGWLNYRIQILSGVYGYHCKGRTTVWQSTKDLFFLLSRPYFLCICSPFPLLACLISSLLYDDVYVGCWD